MFYNDYYERIRGTLFGRKPNAKGILRAAMIDLYPQLPVEKLVGGSFVILSGDYGMTWSDPIRLPVSAPHGPAGCKDGTLIYLGKEYYANTEKTFEAFENAKKGIVKRITAKTWSEYIDALEVSRCGREAGATPIYAYASTDGGRTWEKRGMCNKPDHLKWYFAHEPHLIELDDGSLYGAIRVENEGAFENDMVVYASRSFDGGYTWTPWECTHISGSPPHLMKQSSGALICSVGRRRGERLGEYALVSEDNGKTWVKEYGIDYHYNDDLGYPASVELDDGSILTVYYQHYRDPKTGSYDKKPCILCTRWTL